MKSSSIILLLKASFAIGAIADFIVAVNWLLISQGIPLPNLISSFRGSGTDYQFAMYIASMFMFGWTAILTWGYLNAIERRGLLMITSVLLLISIIVELALYTDVLHGAGFIWGIVVRLALIGKFSFSYFKSQHPSKTDTDRPVA